MATRLTSGKTRLAVAAARRAPTTPARKSSFIRVSVGVVYFLRLRAAALALRGPPESLESTTNGRSQSAPTGRGETRNSAREHRASCHFSMPCARENRSWYKARHRRRSSATRSGEENDSSRSAATSSMLSRFKTHPTPNSLIHFAMEQSSDPSNRTGLPAANAPKNLEGTTVPVQEGRRLTTCTSAQLSRA